jgi:uncharacterized protein YjbI with pentapeptide repeats
MSKVSSEAQSKKELDSAAIKEAVSAVKIQNHPVEREALEEFAQARERGDVIAQGSLVEYIKEKHYKDKNVVVVPDLTRIGTIEVPNLSGIDFSGVKMTGVIFQNCKLKNAIFCDADLSGVHFMDCNMSGADMRGADLSYCKIGSHKEAWKTYTKEVDEARKNDKPLPEIPPKLAKKYQNMKFSSTADLMDLYSETNKSILMDAEKAFKTKKETDLAAKEAEIAAKKIEVDEAYEKTSSRLASLFGGGNKDADELYDKLSKEHAKLLQEKESLVAKGFYSGDVKYIVDPSLTYIPKTDASFEPGYVRGSTKKERETKQQYVEFNRKDIEDYLQALKRDPELTLNDFAKSKAAEKGVTLHEGSKVVAYAEYGTDLSKLDFTGANLQEACFSAAICRGCIFTNANLNRAIFESADVRGATFQNTKAEGTNFFQCYLDKSTIDDSSFKHAFMRGSQAPGMEVSNSNFDHSNVRNGKWDGTQVDNSTFNYADMEGVSLVNARLSKVKMQYAMLDNAILKQCKIIESNLTDAFLAGADASGATIRDTVLKGVQAKDIDLTDAEIDRLSKLEGIDLENAVMKRVMAEGVNFVGAHMKDVNLEHAQMRDSVLEGVNMRFSNLEGAVLDGAKAAGVDLTGSNVTNVKAKEADFTEAILKDIEGKKADFTKAVMEGADLRGAHLFEATMKKVDLRKADLRNAELLKANLEGAKVEVAKVNAATDIHEANLNGVEGTLVKEGVDGAQTPITAEQLREENAQVHDARSKGTLSRLAGLMFGAIGSGCGKVADFVRQPVSTKWGRIIGGIAGALVVGGIAASAVFTAGASLVVIAGAVAGAAAVGAISGAVVGHYGAKHMGLSTVAAGVAGAALIPVPGGAVMGMAVGAAINRGVKEVAGVSANEFAAQGVDLAGAGAQAGQEYFGVTPKQIQLEQAADAVNANYVPAEREVKPAPKFNREAYKNAVNAALMQEQGVYSTPEPTAKPVAKQNEPTLQEGVERVKDRVAPLLQEPGVSASTETPVKPKEQSPQKAAQRVGEELNRRESTAQDRRDSVGQASENAGNKVVPNASPNPALLKRSASNSQRGKS